MRDDRRRAYDDDRATALAPAPVDPAIERATARADEILRRAEEEAATAIMNAREMAERLIMDARRGAAKEIEVAQEQCNELLAHAMRRWEELTEFERELEERTERVEEVLHALRTALSGEKTPVAPGAPDGRQLGRAEEDILLDLSDQAAVEDGRL
jgi:vacuolar-type H+-ATPase subunit H